MRTIAHRGVRAHAGHAELLQRPPLASDTRFARVIEEQFEAHDFTH
ncbi:hypothetical protein ACFPRL_18925 [Pseudoclavibacter helvolus]